MLRTARLDVLVVEADEVLLERLERRAPDARHAPLRVVQRRHEHRAVALLGVRALALDPLGLAPRELGVAHRGRAPLRLDLLGCEPLLARGLVARLLALPLGLVAPQRGAPPARALHLGVLLDEPERELLARHPLGDLHRGHRLHHRRAVLVVVAAARHRAEPAAVDLEQHLRTNARASRARTPFLNDARCAHGVVSTANRPAGVGKPKISQRRGGARAW